MAQAQDITVNQLPSLTWNWLRMNETGVKQVEITKEASVDRKVPEAVKMAVKDAPSMQDVKSGVGADLDKVLEGNVSYTTLDVADGVKVEDPIVLKFDYKDGENAGSAHEITLGKGAEATVIMIFESAEDAAGTGASQIKYRLAEDALLHIVQVQRMGRGMRFFNDIGGDHKDKSRYELIQIDLTGKETYLGSYSNLAGKSSSIRTDTAYVVQGSDSLDMNFDAYQTGKKTDSLMNVYGVLRDQAKKIYRGTIDFRKGAAESTGAEQEDVLLIDDDVVNRTIPLILCDEEDVEGTHGATIGRLDEGLMFYLESRGIGKEAIYEMMARARVERVANLIKDEETKKYVIDYLDSTKKLDD